MLEMCSRESRKATLHFFKILNFLIKYTRYVIVFFIFITAFGILSVLIYRTLNPALANTWKKITQGRYLQL